MKRYEVTLVNYFDVWGSNGLDPETGKPALQRDDDGELVLDADGEPLEVDLWDDEGFTVNDLCREWTKVFTEEEIENDEKLLKILIDEGFLREGVTLEMIVFNDYGLGEMIEIEVIPHPISKVEDWYKPLGRLEIQEVYEDATTETEHA